MPRKRSKTLLCDVGYFHPHYVALMPNGRYCGHQHATRMKARECHDATIAKSAKEQEQEN